MVYGERKERMVKQKVRCSPLKDAYVKDKNRYGDIPTDAQVVLLPTRSAERGYVSSANPNRRKDPNAGITKL